MSVREVIEHNYSSRRVVARQLMQATLRDTDQVGLQLAEIA